MYGLLMILLTGAGACSHPGFIGLVERSRDLARSADVFEQEPARPAGSLLVVGDSTGVGAGAPEPGQSVAGRIGLRFPGLRVHNLATDGARLVDVGYQLDSIGTERYDMVLVMAGGNDVLRYTSRARLRAEATRINASAMAIARHVVWMPPGNLGSAKLWFWPIDRLLARRSRLVRESLREIAESMCAIYVDLYHPIETDPFAVEPSRYLAGDGLHPSGAGYSYWTAALLEKIPPELRTKWRQTSMSVV